MKLGDSIILITGIFCITMAFVSEFFFHYYLGFMPDNSDIPLNIFWKAEYGEVFNSMTFLTLGIILVALWMWIVRKRRSCTIKPTNFCNKYF